MQSTKKQVQQRLRWNCRRGKKTRDLRKSYKFCLFFINMAEKELSYKSTADIKVSKFISDQIIGQDEGLKIVKKAFANPIILVK